MCCCGREWMFIIQRGVVGKGWNKEISGRTETKVSKREGGEKIKKDIIRHNVREVVNHIPLQTLPNR